MTADVIPASTGNVLPTTLTIHSVDSSVTHVQDNEQVEKVHHVAPGHGESALPEDKVEEDFENAEDDWEDDPENARNWSSLKKWTAVSIVRGYGSYLTVHPMTFICSSFFYRSQPTPSCRPLPAR